MSEHKAGQIVVGDEKTKSRKLSFGRPRFTKKRALIILALALIVAGSFALHDKTRVKIGDTDVNQSKIDAYATLLQAYEKEHPDEKFADNLKQYATDKLILNAALKLEAKKHGVVVSDDDLVKSVNREFPTRAGQAGYLKMVRSKPVSIELINMENLAYQSKLKSVVLDIKSLTVVKLLLDSPYYNRLPKDQVQPAYDAAKARLTNDFLPLIKSNAPESVIAAKGDIDEANPAIGGSSDGAVARELALYVAQGAVSVKKITDYQKGITQFNDVDDNGWSRGNIGRILNTTTEVSKLKKAGDNTGVFASQSGAYMIIRLDKASGGNYDNWADFLNSYKNKYAKGKLQLAITKVGDNALGLTSGIVQIATSAGQGTASAADLCGGRHAYRLMALAVNEDSNTLISGVKLNIYRDPAKSYYDDIPGDAHYGQTIAPGTCGTVGNHIVTTNGSASPSGGNYIDDDCYDTPPTFILMNSPNPALYKPDNQRMSDGSVNNARWEHASYDGSYDLSGAGAGDGAGIKLGYPNPPNSDGVNHIRPGASNGETYTVILLYKLKNQKPVGDLTLSCSIGIKTYDVYAEDEDDDFSVGSTDTVNYRIMRGPSVVLSGSVQNGGYKGDTLWGWEDGVTYKLVLQDDDGTWGPSVDMVTKTAPASCKKTTCGTPSNPCCPPSGCGIPPPVDVAPTMNISGDCKNVYVTNAYDANSNGSSPMHIYARIYAKDDAGNPIAYDHPEWARFMAVYADADGNATIPYLELSDILSQEGHAERDNRGFYIDVGLNNMATNGGEGANPSGKLGFDTHTFIVGKNCFTAKCDFTVTSSPGLPANSVVAGSKFKISGQIRGAFGTVPTFVTSYRLIGSVPGSVSDAALTASLVQKPYHDLDDPLNVGGNSGISYPLTFTADDEGSNKALGFVGAHENDSTTTLTAPASGDIDLIAHPDYSGGFRINEGDGGSACRVKIKTYSPFTLTRLPKSVMKPTEENPSTVDYRADVQTNGPKVSVSTSAKFYKIPYGQPANAPITGPITSSGPFSSTDTQVIGDSTYTVTDPVKAGDQFCTDIKTAFTTGYVNTIDSTDVSGTNGESTESACPSVSNKPFVKIYHSSVLAGGDFLSASGAATDTDSDVIPPNSCQGGGRLAAWANNSANSGATALGSGAELSAMAFTQIVGFASAQTRGDRLPTRMTFANTENADISTDYASPKLGGNYLAANGVRCIVSQDAPKDTPKAAPAASDVDPAVLDGAHQYRGNVTINASAPISNGKNVGIYADGDVYIKSDVQFSTIGWAKDGNGYNVPSLTVVSRGGNIYVDPGVTELNGVYQATKSAPTKDADGNAVNPTQGGTIYTCGTAYAALPKTQVFNGCNKQLVIHGSFVAEKVNLLRTYGSLRDAGRPIGASVSETVKTSRLCKDRAELYTALRAANPGIYYYPMTPVQTLITYYTDVTDADLAPYLATPYCSTTSVVAHTPAGDCENDGGVAGTKPGCAAEVFDFDVSMYLSSPATVKASDGPLKYDSVTSLPPVL